MIGDLLPAGVTMIDLRSDTVTQPTAAMRTAMAEARVGDDVYGDDPTVNALERRVAELLGKEDAVYMPSGTMTNQVAIRAHTEPGDEVLADARAHVAVLERGAPAALSGVTLRALPGKRGVFTAADVEAAIRRPHPFLPKTQPPLEAGVRREYPQPRRRHGLADGRDRGRCRHRPPPRAEAASRRRAAMERGDRQRQ